jgi:hypothetical protein
MRAFCALVLAALSTSLSATPPVWVPGMPWEPTAPYITVGQDEPGYRNWYLAAPWHATYIKSFDDYLTTWGASGVVPTWQLLRTASDWQKCGAQPFEVPPVQDWPNVVQSLRYIRDHVIPVIGPVEPVSAYRNPGLNRCAAGASESAHRYFQAVDLVPLRPTMRDPMIRQLCAAHARSGPPYGVGLGFYVGLRFHIDSRKFRTWGVNDEGGIACARSYGIAHSSDASAGAAGPSAPQQTGPEPGPKPQFSPKPGSIDAPKS